MKLDMYGTDPDYLSTAAAHLSGLGSLTLTLEWGYLQTLEEVLVDLKELVEGAGSYGVPANVVRVALPGDVDPEELTAVVAACFMHGTQRPVFSRGLNIDAVRALEQMPDLWALREPTRVVEPPAEVEKGRWSAARAKRAIKAAYARGAADGARDTAQFANDRATAISESRLAFERAAPSAEDLGV